MERLEKENKALKQRLLLKDQGASRRLKKIKVSDGDRSWRSVEGVVHSSLPHLSCFKGRQFVGPLRMSNIAVFAPACDDY